MTRTGPTLAPAPGPRHGPGTGANTGPAHPCAAGSAFARARDGYLIRRVKKVRPPTAFDPGTEAEIIPANSINPHAYTAWLDHIWSAAGCLHPIRLGGHIHRIDCDTGEVTSTMATADLPDGVIYKACGNRRASACPSCAETYRRDAFQLIRAGLIGGKGIPEHVVTHPAVFATFTAPSFGPVHTRPVRLHTCTSKTDCTCKPQPCHARRDAGTCDHGRPLACFTRHRRDDPTLGQPLCLDCYDHDAHVVWNNNRSVMRSPVRVHAARVSRPWRVRRRMCLTGLGFPLGASVEVGAGFQVC